MVWTTKTKQHTRQQYRRSNIYIIGVYIQKTRYIYFSVSRDKRQQKDFFFVLCVCVRVSLVCVVKQKENHDTTHTKKQQEEEETVFVVEPLSLKKSVGRIDAPGVVYHAGLHPRYGRRTNVGCFFFLNYYILYIYVERVYQCTA